MTKFRNTLLAIGAGMALTVAALNPASADVVTFTWDPTTIGLGGSQITANNMVVSDFADITIPGPSFNTFTENAVLTLAAFQLNGNPVSPSGFGSNYSFYAVFTATGTQGPIPTPGNSTTGSFTTGSYTFYANPNSTPSVTLNQGGSPSITGNTGAFALFGGSLLSGDSTLTNTGGGFSPTANLNLSIAACTFSGQVLPSGAVCSGDYSSFFVNPSPNFISMVVGNFSASRTATKLTLGDPTYLDITGGGGNISLNVPEPSTLVLFGTALICFGALERRRRRKQNPVAF